LPNHKRMPSLSVKS